ncbi:CYTH and CHAD domain-containing protein [Acidithiobacillus caldus]|uniref:Adenylate cyclase n=1 Tax=Acidithiobacillus caldus TaxID=33059 RepID=A0A1E7YL38_9PROT|nr:CYTH and CHAD domain-containing protein [Acidithiobacillus caldus]OFC32299.1 adenylate cyclase [Acidithiobacillus caldus]OFC39430.1 adenylate cyclase [Acidithiobacillus caldus]OFC39553.1 adenylate cyclase [Acidithiobacillus caldus]
MERELKLQVLEADAWENILSHPLVDLAAVTPRPMHARYFDTSDHSLQRARIAYRVRLEGEQWVATLKFAGAASGGLHERPEWNVPVAGPQADLGVFDDPELVQILRPYLHLPLAVVLETVFERRERSLTGSQGEHLLLAADRGEIRVKGETLPILELEIELVRGSVAAILKHGADLCAALPLCPESESKFQRGMGLLRSTTRSSPETQQQAQAPKLPGREPAASALREILIVEIQACLAALRVETREGSRSNFHDLRRCVRQLRALLRFCKPLETDTSTHALRLELATWFHRQSGRRDRDALLDHWQNHASEFQLSPAPLTDALLKSDGESANSAGSLAATLLRLWAHLEDSDGFSGSLSLREFAERHLAQMDRKLRRAEIDTDSAEGRAEFHRLRIQIKNFRYVLHCLAGLWPAKDSKGLMKVLGHLQESSGLIRDAQMAASHLLPLGLEAPSELALHAGVLWGYLVARKQREAKKFRKSWARFLEVSRPWD